MEKIVTDYLSPVRWRILTLLFAASLINLLNQMTISVLGTVITVQLHLSNAQFASLTTSFLVAYTLSQGLSGRAYDRIGSRRGLAISVVVWSLASIFQGFVPSLSLMNCLRFALGLGEGGTWPGAAKVIAEWFPAKERHWQWDYSIVDRP
jgi:MFS transporter, ACS family, hexuronate transporter